MPCAPIFNLAECRAITRDQYSPASIAYSKFDFVLKIVGDYYWRYVEYGVTGENIPYDASVRTGAGKSKYIEGLMNWIKIKGIASDNDVVRGIAFAIARKQTAKGGEGLGNPMDKNKLCTTTTRGELRIGAGKSLLFFFLAAIS